MKQFFKFMFASMVGFILSMIVLFFIFMGIVSGLMISLKDDKEIAVKDKSILEIKFEDPIEERTGNDPFKNLDFRGLNASQTPGLDQILKSISKAKTDDKIKGILLDLSDIKAGLSTMEEIRNALIDFRESEKFIYAYSESYSQKAYYLASVADKIYLYPTGTVDLRGLSANLMFFKGTLEKLEIKPEVIRHGKFKSAAEPFMYDKMSDENRQQIASFMNSIWSGITSGIAASRNIEVTELQEIANSMKARKAEDALSLRLIDIIAYGDELIADIKEKLGVEQKDKIGLVPLRSYAKSNLKGENFSAKKIAIVYATGDIVSGEGGDDQTGSDRIAGAIRKARQDSTIKAIVLRVNSPGGSALASDVIWRETVLAKKEKPLVVSMGDYAASGGYYIACAADTIVAQHNTLTGSIGVFGLLFNAQNMFKNKLGITFDGEKTGNYADIGSMTRPMREDERAIIQDEVERIYETFISHVAEGRGIDKAMVDSLGQGRIWSGKEAKNLGLVDVMGGLNDAVGIAARMAGLDNYRTISMPEQKEFIEKLMEDLNAQAGAYFTKRQLGESYKYIREAERLISEKGVLVRMPYSITID